MATDKIDKEEATRASKSKEETSLSKSKRETTDKRRFRSRA